jgi:hypothetical protein
MFDFAWLFIVNNVAILTSVLAILISLVANSRSQKSKQLLESILKQEKHSKVLNELDTQEALFGRLLVVMYEKKILIQENTEKLGDYVIGEIERLDINIAFVEEVRGESEARRNKANSSSDRRGAVFLEKNLADTRRLTIKMEADLLNERDGFSEIKRRLDSKA